MATATIPSPRSLPIIGHLGEFASGTNQENFDRLAKTYGPIFQLNLGKRTVTFLTNQKLVNEACNEKRFHKSVNNVLWEVREGVHDGLFTAIDGEENWGKAHRILVPAFGPLPIRSMFDEMHDIASQLALKIARHSPQGSIDASSDFTRLALDTLALCSMDFRFNSFYSEELHPFIQAMGDFLSEAGRRNRRPTFAPSFLYRSADAKFYADIDIMRKTADDVVKARKQNPTDRKDLLAAMLDGVDQRTGDKLSDDNITSQLITFLIAGHETTSGLLSFAFYELLKHPEAYKKVQQEVDEVIGREPIKVEHLSKLPYIAAMLRETLRIRSTIAAFSVEPYEDTVIDGKYPVRQGQPVICLLKAAHVDPEVFGDDAQEFKPERMVDEKFAKLNKEFPNFWKPFGNGKRACIGRPFAWQESLLCVAMLFQNFDFFMEDPDYELQISETLTMKPADFNMKARLRHGMTATELEHRLIGKRDGTDAASKKDANGKASATTTGKPIAIFYGSNSGTCESMAQQIATDAVSNGFSASTVKPLDEATGKVPKDRPVIIVTASYEGQPPSNAEEFVSWMEGLKGQDLDGVSYSVFGCGHRDWCDTYHRIPKLIDSTFEQRGATRLTEMHGTDAAESDMFSDFEAWEDEKLWPVLKERYGVDATPDSAAASSLSVEVSVPRKVTLRQKVEEAVVLKERTLTAPSAPTKKHIEIQLPKGMTYRPGDYLAILPLNPKETVARVLRRFQLAWDAALRISSEQPLTLPTATTVSASEVLGSYVELSQPATKRVSKTDQQSSDVHGLTCGQNIQALIDAGSDETIIQELKELIGEAHQEKVAAKRLSVLELLEKYPSINLPLGSFLAMLPPMRIRQYSISSSPLADPSVASLTYSVLDQPSFSGQSRHLGVATSFLSSLGVGDRLHVAVRASGVSFHPPEDPETTPLICIGAGAGLAPFRGFFQERASLINSGKKLAPALLFFGCRNPDEDDLYAEELAQWQAIGAVDVRRAYSRKTEMSHGCRYVQDRLYHDREDVWRLWHDGARVYVCGTRHVGKAVEETSIRIAQESARCNEQKEVSEEQAKEWFEKQRNVRFATDVFD